MNSTTISVQWDEVPCLQQNSDITGYIVRYEPVSGDQPSSELITGTDRMASLTDLLPFTNYSIEVAAVNSNDSMGLFSTTITGHTPATSEFYSILTQSCLYVYIKVCATAVAVIRLSPHPISTCTY